VFARLVLPNKLIAPSLPMMRLTATLHTAGGYLIVWLERRNALGENPHIDFGAGNAVIG
jgi:hypothetical protein